MLSDTAMMTIPPPRHLPQVVDLFAAEVHALVEWIEAIPLCVLPEEIATVRGAASARQREYASGRSVARRLLEHLGITQWPLRTGDKGEPIWPEGTTGSITHGGGVCGVVVGSLEVLRCVGFDVEPAVGLGSRAWHHVITEEERAWLEQQPGGQRAILATLLLSCKESVAKACFHECGNWFGFLDIDILVDLPGRMFRARLSASAANPPDNFEEHIGRFTCGEDLFVTAFTRFRR